MAPPPSTPSHNALGCSPPVRDNSINNETEERRQGDGDWGGKETGDRHTDRQTEEREREREREREGEGEREKESDTETERQAVIVCVFAYLVHLYKERFCMHVCLVCMYVCMYEREREILRPVRTTTTTTIATTTTTNTTTTHKTEVKTRNIGESCLVVADVLQLNLEQSFLPHNTSVSTSNIL